LRYYRIEVSGAQSSPSAASTQGAAGAGASTGGAAPQMARRGLFAVTAPNDDPLGSSVTIGTWNPNTDPDFPVTGDMSGGGQPVPSPAGTYEPGGGVMPPYDPLSSISTSNGSSGSNAATTPAGTLGGTPNTPDTSTPMTSTGGAVSTTWTSVYGGVNDPGALDIEFQIELGNGIASDPNTAQVTIFGIPLQLISQSNNFSGRHLKMFAGYTNGLPLANDQVPHQGLILEGTIFPCYGNWVMNNLSITFVVTPGGSSGSGTGGPTDPKNVIHNMPKGTKLSDAIHQALSTAFPSMSLDINISDKLVLPYSDWGFHQSITQYAYYVKALSHSILGTPTQGYQGVSIAMNNTKTSVKDGTVKGGVISLAYEDIVGQPTWLKDNTIQVTTLLRGDIDPLASGGQQQIKIPPSLVTMNESQAMMSIPGGSGTPGLNGNYLTFQGTWDVTVVRHIGHFRDPSWNSWVTIIEAVQSGQTGSGGGGGDTPAPSTGGEQTFTPSGAAPGQGGGIGRN
jgi:hypothetical protein